MSEKVNVSVADSALEGQTHGGTIRLERRVHIQASLFGDVIELSTQS